MMSKFKCTTNTENEISSGPLIFFQLETLANVLLSETLDLQQEFRTKAEFVNEWFRKIFKNELEIEHIVNMSLEVQQDLTNVELELQMLECTFQQFQKTIQNLETVSKMETYCIRNKCGCGCCCFCRCKTERQNFLELLEKTNGTVEELPGLLDGMRELGLYRKLKNPYADIVAVLNYHCEILQNTEKNMNVLLDKLSLIELQQLSLKNQIK